MRVFSKLTSHTYRLQQQQQRRWTCWRGQEGSSALGHADEVSWPSRRRLAETLQSPAVVRQGSKASFFKRGSWQCPEGTLHGSASVNIHTHQMCSTLQARQRRRGTRTSTSWRTSTSEPPTTSGRRRWAAGATSGKRPSPTLRWRMSTAWASGTASRRAHPTKLPVLNFVQP